MRTCFPEETTIKTHKLSLLRPEQPIFIKYLPNLLCFILFFAHLGVIIKYSVNIPYWDEWDLVTPRTFSSSPTFQWLFEQHNEHRIIPTKILSWLVAWTTHFNLKYSILLNWLIYAILLGTVYSFGKKLKPTQRTSILWFFPFLFSTVNYENHLWGFQSQFHFFILFFFISTLFIFNLKLSWPQLSLGILFIIGSIFSLSAGIICSVVLAGSFAIWQVARIYGNSSKIREPFPYAQTAVFVGLVLLANGLWLHGWVKPIGHPAIMLPYRRTFLKYFLNIISLGFGIKKENSLLGSLCLVWILFPLYKNLKNPKTRTHPTFWAILTAIGGLLGTLAVISMGRAGFGTVLSKSSRYSEIGMMLIPLTVMAWQIYLEDSPPWLKRRVFSGFWIVLFFSFFNQWQTQDYRSMFDKRTQGVACVRKYFKAQLSLPELARFKSPVKCPTLFPDNIMDQLETARNYHLSFYQDFLESDSNLN